MNSSDGAFGVSMTGQALLLQREAVSDDYTKGFISMQPTPAKHVGSSRCCAARDPDGPDQERGFEKRGPFWISGTEMR